MPSGYAFPTLPPAQIAEALTQYGIAPVANLRPDDIAKPLPDLLSAVLSRFIALYVDAPGDGGEDSRLGFKELDALDNPEHHAEGIRARRLYDKSRAFLESIHVKDFTLDDLLDPHPLRVVQLLTALVSFLHHREDKLCLLHPIADQAAQQDEPSMAKIAQKEIGDHQLAEQMDEPIVQQLEAYVNGLQLKAQVYSKHQLSALEEEISVCAQLKNLQKMAMQNVQEKTASSEIYNQAFEKLAKQFSKIQDLQEKVIAAKTVEKEVKAVKAKLNQEPLVGAAAAVAMKMPSALTQKEIGDHDLAEHMDESIVQQLEVEVNGLDLKAQAYHKMLSEITQADIELTKYSQEITKLLSKGVQSRQKIETIEEVARLVQVLSTGQNPYIPETTEVTEKLEKHDYNQEDEADELKLSAESVPSQQEMFGTDQDSLHTTGPEHIDSYIYKSFQRSPTTFIFSWRKRPYRGIHILPPVRLQEPVMYANRPHGQPRIFNVRLSDKHLKAMVDTFMQSEEAKKLKLKSGDKLATCFLMAKRYGVVSEEDFDAGRLQKAIHYKIKEYSELSAFEKQQIPECLDRGEMFASSFRVTIDYLHTLPHDIYRYRADAQQARKPYDVHCVILTSSGLAYQDLEELGEDDTQKAEVCYEYLNSYSSGFGMDGCGLVYADSIRKTYRIKVVDM